MKSLITQLIAVATILLATPLYGATISWSNGASYNGPNGFLGIDTTGTLVEAIDAEGTIARTVDPGGLNITFTPANLLNGGGFNSGTPGTTDSEWNAIINRTDFSTTNAAANFSLGGLTVGNDYQIQLFTSDDRGCCFQRTEFASDGAGSNSSTVVQGTFTSMIGSFTADAATQNISLSANSNNPVISAYVTRDITGVPAPPLVAGPVGNDLTSRTANGDGATQAVLYSNFVPMAGTGSVESVNTFFQGANNGNFRIFQLRPTGNQDEYDVIFDSGAINPTALGATPNAINEFLFPNGPTDVLEGDIFAHFGETIPFSSRGQANTNNLQAIFFPVALGSVSGTITLDDATFTRREDLLRDYAWAVNFEPAVPEPATAVLGLLGLAGLGMRRRRNA